MSKTNFNEQIYQEIRILFLRLAYKEDEKDLFPVRFEEAYKFLRLEVSDTAKANLIKRYLNDEKHCFIRAENEQDKCAHFIIRLDGRKKIPWFSYEGFKMLCLVSHRSPMSKYILKHFIQMEKDYLRVLQQSEHENKKEFETLLYKFDRQERELASEKKANERLISENYDLHIFMHVISSFAPYSLNYKLLLNMLLKLKAN